MGHVVRSFYLTLDNFIKLEEYSRIVGTGNTKVLSYAVYKFYNEVWKKMTEPQKQQLKKISYKKDILTSRTLTPSVNTMIKLQEISLYFKNRSHAVNYILEWFFENLTEDDTDILKTLFY